MAWSLAVEEYFYLIFPIIIYFSLIKIILRKAPLFSSYFCLLFVFFSFFVDSNFYRTGTFLRIDSILLGFLLSVFSIEKN